ncbi:Cysteine-rich protein 2-binding protein [Apophysomyces sp. BC1034]|nr:Cysteine-rich protein 2-binding protein [Apophysomyces sp. BC1021]KAG0189626.1 Cysteine-rich protein 2-binding protein [Apophysomyces sp. BC1034]
MRRQSFADSKIKDRDHKYFRWKEDVCALIDDYWEYLAPDKQKSITWHNTVASVLSTHSTIFQSGFEKFHQSAWWTLHKEEPPVKETKTKTAAVKPNLKRPLKRARNETASENHGNKEKRQRPTRARTVDSTTVPKVKEEKERLSKKKDTTEPPPSVEADNDDDDDILELSSLSDLSSDSELFSADSDNEASADDKLTTHVKQEANDTDETKETTEVLPRIPVQDTIPEPVRPEEPPISTSQHDRAIPETENAPCILIEREDIEGNETPSEVQKPIFSEHHDDVTKEQMSEEKVQVKAEGAITSVQKSNVLPSILSQHVEWMLLQKLENSTRKMPTAAIRFKRKLGVRRLKRNLGMKIFDLDNQVASQLRSAQEMVPMSKRSTIKRAANQEENTFDHQIPSTPAPIDPITYTPYTSSFASRLYGCPWRSNTITRNEPWLSTWNGRKLRPYIRRDFENKPVRMKLLQQIRQQREEVDGRESMEEQGSIDYVYFQREHLAQVNELLCRCFWDGIDVSESLMYPEFSVLALYKRYVIGCAFMTPEAYITYFAVLPGWEGAGIGQFMLYHLFQTAISKDITLHVSANNNAMILYQKFGFKPEEFIVNFYDKYLPPDSVFSKNAFFLRLRR